MSVEITVGAVTPVHLYGEKEQTNKQKSSQRHYIYTWTNGKSLDPEYAYITFSLDPVLFS